MKKLILALFVVCTQFTLVWDTRANDHLLLFFSPKYTVNTNGLPASEASAAEEKSSFISRFWPFKTKQSATATSARLLLSEDNPRAARQVGELLYSNDQISVSNIYPNPASSQAAFDYVLSSRVNSAKIIIYDVLANVVGEYQLVRDAQKIYISTTDLTSGVYFYTLSVDGKNVVTRKLIVKHHS